MSKRIVVLGCAGSIGRQGLDVIRQHPKEFEVLALQTGSNAEELILQAREFHPKYAAITDERCYQQVKEALPGVEVLTGKDAAATLASLQEADVILHGISGIEGLPPLLSGLKAQKTVALANKEAIVCAHDLIDEALDCGGTILPVDSEQSALFQALNAGRRQDVERLILTASGGPFFRYTFDELKSVTAEEARKHPVWNMGEGITIDSATMFNKGLEIIEASYLFGIEGEKIDVLIHPNSIVHSMVEFCDGVMIAQMGVPDMRTCIQYAFTYPERKAGIVPRLSLKDLNSIEFFEPDKEKFRALPLAYQALREGKVLPIVYHGANVAARSLFLQGKISFLQIADCVEYALEHIRAGAPNTADDVFTIHRQAETLVFEALRKG